MEKVVIPALKGELMEQVLVETAYMRRKYIPGHKKGRWNVKRELEAHLPRGCFLGLRVVKAADPNNRDPEVIRWQRRAKARAERYGAIAEHKLGSKFNKAA